LAPVHLPGKNVHRWYIEQIMAMFDSKADVEYVAKSVSFEDVATNDYNLSVSSYVEVKDTREVIHWHR
jgi:type I restriction enzyme M protein